MDQPAAAWRPTAEMMANANLTALMADGGFKYYDELHRWSVLDPMGFWGEVIDRLGIVFSVPPDAIIEGPAEDPTWLAGARMNIVDSCFTAPPDRTAVVFRRSGASERMSYAELQVEVARFASGLVEHGVRPGERVAIAMPMTIEAGGRLPGYGLGRGGGGVDRRFVRRRRDRHPDAPHRSGAHRYTGSGDPRRKGAADL